MRKEDVRITDITTTQGEQRLSIALAESNGRAFTIVHPLYPEKDGWIDIDRSRHNEYKQYKRRLKTSLVRYRGLNVPIILFEGQPQMERIDKTLAKIGFNQGEVFVVTTEKRDPRPVGGEMEDITTKLVELGLERTVVSGSYNWKYFRSDPIPAYLKGKPQISRRYRFSGCVGGTIEDLLVVGVTATTSHATFYMKDSPLKNAIE